ncbi:heptosyltransferase II [Phycisphaerales bacterium]|nr:heptosyltransferase II [Phycisphaerales bacterium]
MATPTLRAVRAGFPGIFVGGLCRPGIDELLAGTDFFDELHVERAAGVMGPKFIAAKVRPRRYDTALLLTNSFSTALTVRIAGVPRRVGYDRDARGLLLTDRMPAPKRPDGSWEPVPAVRYYWALAERFILPASRVGGAAFGPLELGVTPAQDGAANHVLARAFPGIDLSRGLAILNPGGNNPSKRWPADRFARLAAGLVRASGWAVAVNGSPKEVELTRDIVTAARSVLGADAARVGDLAANGITLGSLKGIVKRSGLMVTNDTGPRHIAAAFGVPLVSLFGPTDHRWTTIPTRPEGPETILLAAPSLPESEAANDHPDRCAIERVEYERVWAAAEPLIRAGMEPSKTPHG